MFPNAQTALNESSDEKRISSARYLFLNVFVRTAEQKNEDRHSTGIDDEFRLIGVARGDVRQRPSGFELKKRKDDRPFPIGEEKRT